MEDYVEDFKYNNCFWQKSKILYEHAEKKFKEYMSVGNIFGNMAKSLNTLCSAFDKIPTLLIDSNDNSSRFKGIKELLIIIGQINSKFKQLFTHLNKLSKEILEKQFCYNSKKDALSLCENSYNEYANKLNELNNKNKNYTEAINKAVEINKKKKKIQS